MAERLVLVGAGGLGREVVTAVEAVNAVEARWQVTGFVDDDPALAGATIHGYPVLGPLGSVSELDDSTELALCVASPGRPFTRKQVARTLDPEGRRLATIVHPGASIAPSTVIGEGSIILAGVVTTADVVIGAGTLVMPHATITHDDLLEDFVVCASAVALGGNVHVGEGAYLGAGCRIREHRSIGAWSIVGMGAVVLDDIPVGQIWTGCPARYLRSIELDGGTPL